ncbi:MAG TPA: DUF1549 domain-containing protein, partial [Gemmataceae bacterium]|nr:DUF1549 domain-containing protein [Gemmataceae bacterium]
MFPAFSSASSAVSSLRNPLACLTLLLAAQLPALADAPTASDQRAALIGQPMALIIQPSKIVLEGPRAMQQLVVTGQYADGTVRDLTAVAAKTVLSPGLAVVTDTGWLAPKMDGHTSVRVEAGGKTVQVPLVVHGFTQPRPISFRHEVIGALNVGGCNQGACHGTPSGKNGFKLSLRGYDPGADYLELTRDVLGRRTDRLDPDASLILQKALGRIPHEGGKRFGTDTVAARILRGWIAGGLRDDPSTLPTLQRIAVWPGNRVLHAPARWQQLSVQADFSDGSVRDVTRLSVFSSSDPGVASVSPEGLVEFRGTGEVAVLCRYLDLMLTARLTYLEPKKGFHWNNPRENNYIDKHVFAKLRMLNILPSDLCTDSEFIRRATMDICGVLPTAAQTRAFLASKDVHKRARLIDTLLAKPEYAEFWTLKWSDVLRSNRKTIQEKGTHVFQRWLRRAVANNTPFDQVVRDLLTAGGSTYRHPAANYYRIVRDPQGLAETTAQLFCGIRLQCAKCHNHPFERWTQDDYYSMAAFFARVRHKRDSLDRGPDPMKPGGAEVVYDGRAGEMTQPRTGQVM